MEKYEAAIFNLDLLLRFSPISEPNLLLMLSMSFISKKKKNKFDINYNILLLCNMLIPYCLTAKKSL